jgi:N-acyl-D-aspartate/D-glutamate deacylase
MNKLTQARIWYWAAILALLMNAYVVGQQVAIEHYGYAMMHFAIATLMLFTAYGVSTDIEHLKEEEELKTNKEKKK